jgi:hypothetical protein
LQKEPPRSIPLHVEVPDGAPHKEPSSDELDWPEGAKTGAPEWQTPNWTPPAHFPQLNFKNGDLVCSDHGDRAPREQFKVFPMIYFGLVQLVGPMSYRNTQGCWNKVKDNMIEPVESCPR